MKKLLVAVLLVALGAGAAFYFLVVRGAKSRTCERVHALCGAAAAGAGKGECPGELGELERTLGREAMSKLEQCVATAPSCAKAAECLAGIGLDAATSAFGDVLEGIKDAFE